MKTKYHLLWDLLSTFLILFGLYLLVSETGEQLWWRIGASVLLLIGLDWRISLAIKRGGKR